MEKMEPSDYDSDEEEEDFLSNLPDRNMFLGSTTTTIGRTTSVPQSFVFCPSTKGLEGLVQLIKDRRGEAMGLDELRSRSDWEEAYLDSHILLVLNPGIVKDKGMQRMHKNIPFDCVRIVFLIDYINTFRKGDMKDLPTPNKSKYRIGPSICKDPASLDLVFLTLKKWRDVMPTQQKPTPMSVATFVSEIKARQHLDFDEDTSSSAPSEDEDEKEVQGDSDRTSDDDDSPPAKIARREKEKDASDNDNQIDSDTLIIPSSVSPILAPTNTTRVNLSLSPTTSSSSSSSSSASPPMRKEPLRPRQLLFTTESFVPPVDKRGIGTKRSAPPREGTWIRTGIGEAQKQGVRAETAKFSSIFRFNANKELERSPLPVTATDKGKNQRSTPRTLNLNASPKASNKEGGFIPLSGPNDLNRRIGNEENSRPTTSNQAVRTLTGYDNIMSVDHRRKRNTIPSPDMDIILDDDETNNIGGDDSVVEEPVVTNTVHHSKPALPKKLPAVPVKKPKGGKRDYGKYVHNYTHGDSQMLVDVVMKNRWGRYCKGQLIWTFIVDKELLKNTNLKNCTDQALMTHFKKKVRPKLEDYSQGRTNAPPYIIEEEDWRSYQSDCAIAAQNMYVNSVTQFPIAEFSRPSKFASLKLPPFR